MKKFFDTLYLQTRKKSELRSRILYALRPSIPQKFHLKLTFRFTQNNVFASLRNMSTNRLLLAVSSGSLGFRGRLQKSKAAIQQMLHFAFKETRFFPQSTLSVEISGSSWLKNFLIRRLISLFLRPKVRVQLGLKKDRVESAGDLSLISCKINSLKAFNGCRRRKPRH